MIPLVTVVIPPGTQVSLPGGTQLTATTGPACPSTPGFFLCPDMVSCAPVGGVCCPMGGSCNAGDFCDWAIPNNCVSSTPGANPRFCPGSGDPVTGIALVCPIGMSCDSANLCH